MNSPLKFRSRAEFLPLKTCLFHRVNSQSPPSLDPLSLEAAAGGPRAAAGGPRAAAGAGRGQAGLAAPLSPLLEVSLSL